MLILSRHKNERIRIGDNVIIEVMDIKNDKARIGISAPKDVAVYRQEVYEAIHSGTDSDSVETPKF